ncbi:MAG: hypothetical protein KBS59_05360, partial [Clostridiales bacterium]|nr:hypothetical protein [Clostridiales bacterium]
VHVGDEIDFECGGETIRTKAVDLYRANSFMELFGMASPRDFGCESDCGEEDFVRGMREYYTEDKEKEYGVLGIKIKLI